MCWVSASPAAWCSARGGMRRFKTLPRNDGG
jgi:hypothetical protein